MSMIKKVKREEDLEEARRKVILNGSFVKGELEGKEKKEESSEKGYKYHSLRMPVDIMSKVDELKAKRAGISRTIWIMEAIQEKIKREAK